MSYLKYALSSLAVGALFYSTAGISAVDPAYLNYPHEQRQISPAPAYAPKLGITTSAGQIDNGIIEATYQNYARENGNQPYRHRYNGDYVPKY